MQYGKLFKLTLPSSYVNLLTAAFFPRPRSPGIVAILFCGMAQSHYTAPNLSSEARIMVVHITEILNFMSENFIFAYLGISLFTFTQHKWRPGFIALSIVCGCRQRQC